MATYRLNDSEQPTYTLPGVQTNGTSWHTATIVTAQSNRVARGPRTLNIQNIIHISRLLFRSFRNRSRTWNPMRIQKKKMGKTERTTRAWHAREDFRFLELPPRKHGDHSKRSIYNDISRFFFSLQFQFNHRCSIGCRPECVRDTRCGARACEKRWRRISWRIIASYYLPSSWRSLALHKSHRMAEHGGVTMVRQRATDQCVEQLVVLRAFIFIESRRRWVDCICFDVLCTMQYDALGVCRWKQRCTQIQPLRKQSAQSVSPILALWYVVPATVTYIVHYIAISILLLFVIHWYYVRIRIRSQVRTPHVYVQSRNRFNRMTTSPRILREQNLRHNHSEW